jgi:predicted phosphodiesterase
MKKITLLSDSHGFVDEAIKKHCHSADEVWHAGDVGAYNPERCLWKYRRTSGPGNVS